MSKKKKAGKSSTLKTKKSAKGKTKKKESSAKSKSKKAVVSRSSKKKTAVKKIAAKKKKPAAKVVSNRNKSAKKSAVIKKKTNKKAAVKAVDNKNKAFVLLESNKIKRKKFPIDQGVPTGLKENIVYISTADGMKEIDIANLIVVERNGKNTRFALEDKVEIIADHNFESYLPLRKTFKFLLLANDDAFVNAYKIVQIKQDVEIKRNPDYVLSPDYYPLTLTLHEASNGLKKGDLITINALHITLVQRVITPIGDIAEILMYDDTKYLVSELYDDIVALLNPRDL